MTRLRLVMCIVLGGCLPGLVVCSALATVASAAASKPALVLHLKWRELTTSETSISTSDAYAAVLTCAYSTSYSCPPQLLLINAQAGTQQTVAPPSRCGTNFAPAEFGGPYLVVSCRGASPSTWLYNLDSREWRPVPVSVSPKCPIGGCGGVVAVGSHWLKLESDGAAGCAEHCPVSDFLQSIQTGHVKRDPAKPGGRILDDLNLPSGEAPLCAPLRYPGVPDPAALVDGGGSRDLGSLEFSGPFALAVGAADSVTRGLYSKYQLERCGSRKVLNIDATSSGAAPFLSSRAVVTLATEKEPCPKNDASAHSCAINPDEVDLQGVFLPGLQRFTAQLPNVNVAVGNGLQRGNVVGLTRSTIYVDAPDGGALWAATLPQPPTSRGH